MEKDTMTDCRSQHTAGDAGFIRWIVVAVAVSLFSVGSAVAGENVWRFMGPHGGGTSSVAVDPSDPQTVYVGGAVGAFKSTDGGSSWTTLPVSGSSVAAIAVDPGDTRIVYAGSNYAGIHKSIDGGTTWTPINAGLPSEREPVRAVAIVPSSPETVYILAGDKPFRSTDGGASWSALNTVLPVGSEVPHLGSLGTLVTDPVDTLTAYVGGSLGVFRTTDGGSSWARISSGLPLDRSIDALAISPSDSLTMFCGVFGSVYRSVDGGISWAEAASGLPKEQRVEALAFDGASPPTVYAAGDSGVYRSTDNGLSWMAANTGLSEGVWVSGMAVSPDDPGTMYVATGNGVFKTCNGGLSWTAINDGLAGHSVRTAVVALTDPVTVYVTNRGFHRSTDGGATWTTMGPELDRPPSQVLAAAVDPSNPETVYFEGAGPLYKTTDGGVTWSQIWKPSGLGPTQMRTDIRAIAVDPSDSETIYIGMAGGASLVERRIQKSTDGGETWFPVDSGLNETGSYTAIAIAPSDPKVLYTGGGWKGVYRSVDGAASWTNINPDIAAHAIAVDPVDANIVYVASTAVHKTTDGGASWTASPDIDPQALAIDPEDRDVLYAGTDNGVLRSTDGGATWADLSQGLPVGSVRSLALDPETRTMYASQHGVYALEIGDAGDQPQPDDPGSLTPTGDFDEDGSIGFTDFLLFARAYGSPQQYDLGLDMNQDGYINFFDFLAFAKVYGQEAPASTPVELPLDSFVYIRPGTFMMGSPESEEGRYDDRESPYHEVTISTGFYLGKYEVTQELWNAVMRTTPWATRHNVVQSADNPVVVWWPQAQEFVQRLNAAAGDSLYRLPTEAEWEYACRAGTTTRWSFGDDEDELGKYAWCYENCLPDRAWYGHEVGTLRPNPWGLYDMHGNVDEWCLDWHGYYPGSPQTDPLGPPVGPERVRRGGSFHSKMRDTRSASRPLGTAGAITAGTKGFRLLRRHP
jgi:formylglycine-generating enzyme required for sulfatase activity